jgi:ssDNA-binding replication factor A large subunit
MDSIEGLLKEISGKSGKPREEIKGMIEEKQAELSGLVSPEGAAYIVGRELGVSLLKESSRQLKAKNIIPGMRSVDFLGRITRITEPREFERKGKTGRVVNLFLGDDSGSIRLSLWDKETDMVEGDQGLKEGDVVRVARGWVKKDYRGGSEIRLGRSGKVVKVEEETDIPDLEDLKPPGFGDRSGPGSLPVNRVPIEGLKDGDFAEVRGCLVQVFKRRPFYQVCPQCDGKLEEKDGKYSCREHGGVEPKRHLIFSGVLDDGSGNIRMVLFRELAEKLVGKSPEELVKAFEGRDPAEVYEDFPGLGREFIVRGRVRTDDFSGSLEIIGNSVEEVDLKRECEGLIGTLAEPGKNQ